MGTKREFDNVPSIDSDLLLPYLDSLHEELSRKETNNGGAAATDDTSKVKAIVGATSSAETQTDTVIIVDIIEQDEEAQLDTGADEGRKDEKDQIQGINEEMISWKPSYLDNHFDLMHYLALYLNKAGPCSSKFAVQVHSVTFALVAALSLLQGLGATKHYILNYAERGSVYHYITIWYYLHSVLVSLYFLILILCGKIAGFFNNNCSSHPASKPKLKVTVSKRFSKIAVVVALTSVISSGYESTGLNHVIEGHDFKDIIETKAFHISKRLLIWSRENYTDKLASVAENIWDDGYTPENLALGFIDIILEFVGWLQYYMIRDVMLMAALTLYSYAEVYMAFLKSIDNLDSSTLDKMWGDYNALYKVSCEMEACFGSLFQLVHIDNWLFCAYFLVDSLEEDTEIDAAFVTNLLIVLKIVATYCLAAVANNTSTQFKRHLNSIRSSTKNASKLEEMELTLKLIHLEQKINNSPVGLGSGNFLITENYAFKFMGSVVSSFLFFMDSQKK